VQGAQGLLTVTVAAWLGKHVRATRCAGNRAGM
jgi:hypothetical protein